MARYKLRPRPTKNGKWRLSIVAQLSPTGRRQQLYFDSHSQALAAANNLRKQHDQFGRSLRFLEPARLAESVEVWQMLDQAAISGKAAFGTLRNIIIREIKAQKERAKSCSLNSLFDQYLQKLQRNGRSQHYMKAFRWTKNLFRQFAEEKVSDLSAQDFTGAFAGLQSGSYNAHLRLLRAVMSFGVQKGFCKTNIAQKLEFAVRPKTDLQSPLPDEVVKLMLKDAAENNLELLPSMAIGLFTGAREAELARLLWSDIKFDEHFILLRAEISKTKRKRILPLKPNLVEWLDLYRRKADSKGRILKLTPSRLRDGRLKNWQAATDGKLGGWPQNCRRISFATNFACAYGNLSELALILGHSTLQTSFDHYIGAVSKSLALQFFEIRP